MPQSLAARVTTRNATMPRRWPSIAGMRRSRAQRRLPSMMIATCPGSLSASSETSLGGRSIVAIRGGDTVRSRTGCRAAAYRSRARAGRAIPHRRWRDTAASARAARVRARPAGGAPPTTASRPDRRSPSDLHDLFLFVGHQFVDLLDEAVGKFLHVIAAALDAVLGDLPALLQALDLVDRLMADVSDGDLVLLGFLFDHLDQVFA